MNIFLTLLVPWTLFFIFAEFFVKEGRAWSRNCDFANRGPAFRMSSGPDGFKISGGERRDHSEQMQDWFRLYYDRWAKRRFWMLMWCIEAVFPAGLMTFVVYTV